MPPVATIKLQKYRPFRFLNVMPMMKPSSMTLYRAIAANADIIIWIAGLTRRL
jgi:hypothetical protein